MRFSLPRLITATGTKRRRFVIRNREPLKRDADRLLAIYMRVIKHWRGAVPRIVARYEVAARQRGIVDSWPYNGHPKYLQDAEDDVIAQLDTEANWYESVIADIRILFADWGAAVEWWNRSKWTNAIFSSTGVDLKYQLTSQDVAMTVQDRIAVNLELIRDVNAQQRAKMVQVIHDGYQQSMSARDIAKKLQEVTGFGAKRAKLIASVENVKIATALDRERFKQAGIETAEYKHSRKAHPRLWHKARDGKVYDLTTRKQVDGDDEIRADDMPGIPIRCGCNWSPVIDIDAKTAALEAEGALMSQAELDRLMAGE